MATIKTTTKVETTALPFPINYMTSSTSVLTANNQGRLTVTEEASYIPSMSFGTEGGYIYVQSPISNSPVTTITIWLVIPNQSDLKLASIKPGESMILPLASSQTSLYATTNLGKTSLLDYYTGDKGGEWGQSVLLLMEKVNYEYIIMDSGAGQFSESVDTGLNVNDWIYNSLYLVHDKGYVLEFFDVGGDVNYVFVDSRGLIVPNSIPPDAGLGIDMLQRSIIKTYEVGIGASPSILPTSGITVFDGDNVFNHEFVGSSASRPAINWEYDSTADGSIGLYVDYPDGLISTYLINGAEKTLLTSIDSTTDVYADLYTDNFCNFILARTYDNISGYTLRFQIFDTTGLLLQDLDVSAYNLMDGNINFYGDNRIQLVYLSQVDGFDYMFNYNHELDRFVGKNFEWKENRGIGTDRLIEYRSKNIGYSNSYEYNGVAILYWNAISTVNNNSVLNVETDDLKIYYLLDGMTTFGTYQINQTIWFNQYETGVSATSVFITWATGNVTGALKTLVLTSVPYTIQNINTNSSTVINDYSLIYSYNFPIWSIAGNNHIIHGMYGNDESTVYFAAVTRGLSRLLTLSNMNGINIRTALNTVSVSATSNNSVNSVSFYYNFKQNSFIALDRYYQSSYDTPDNFSDYSVGELKKYGNRLVLLDDRTNSLFIKVLTESSFTSTIQLPVLVNYYFRTGDNFIMLAYQPSLNSHWIINVYDMSLNLTTSYNTGISYVFDATSVDNRVFLTLSADNTNITKIIGVCIKGVFTTTETDFINVNTNSYDDWC